MSTNYLDLLFVRFIIPIVLFGVTVVRYNAFSFVYLIFLLACPLLPLPSSKNSRIKVQVHLILLITLSCIFTLSHPTLHIVLAVAPPFENALRECRDSLIATQIGVQRLDGIISYRAMRLVLPDIVILSVAVSSLVYFSRRKRPIYISHGEGSSNKNINDSNTENASELGYNVENAPHKKNQLVTNDSDSKTNYRLSFNLDFSKNMEEHQKILWRAWAIDSLCIIITILLICFSGITSPSLPSSIYLFSFLGISTYWACSTSTNSKTFAILRIFLAVYSGLHVCLFYLYQFPFFQEYCKDGEFLARLMGLYYITRTTCDRPGEIVFPNNVRVVDCLAPPLVFLLYYVLVLETRRWLDSDFGRLPQISLFRNHVAKSTLLSANQERKRLISKNTRSDDENTSALELSAPIRFLNGASADSVHDIDDVGADAALVERPVTAKLINSTETPIKHSAPVVLPENFIINPDSDGITCFPSSSRQFNPKETPIREAPVYSLPTTSVGSRFDAFFGLSPPFTYKETNRGNLATERPFLLSLHCSAIRNSYILTLIAMMAWAVVYKSWLSFILLLSACIIWIVPNSRAACLYSSPLIVLYAIVLNIIQFVYGLNLKTNELPEQATPHGIQLTELGMQRWTHSVGALSLQVGFLTCFWLTLRLFVIEKVSKRMYYLHAEAQKKQFPQTTTSCTNYDNSSNINNNSSANTNNNNSNNHDNGDDDDDDDEDEDNPENIINTTARNLSSTETANRTHRSPNSCFINKSDMRSTDRNLLTLQKLFVSSNFAHIINSHLRFETDPNFSNDCNGFTLPFGTVDNAFYKKLTEFLHSVCVKYWIVVCCMSMLFVSVQQPVVVFRIVYMIMLIYFMFLFQISYQFWRRQMIIFWWVNVVYSMTILLCIYTYQFEISPKVWYKVTGLSPEILKAIGLETFESAALFDSLLTPVVFLVVIILQVRYFHEPFLRRSALDRFQCSQNLRDSIQSHSAGSLGRTSPPLSSANSSMSNFIEDVNSAVQTLISKLTNIAVSLNNHFWRFLQIHWIKVIALAIVLTAVNEVCAFNIVSLIILVICFPFTYLHGFMATMIFVWCGIQTFCKMSYQLNAVHLNISTHCETETGNYSTSDLNAWLGLKKVDHFRQYIFPLSALVVLCVVWHAIAYRQRQFYNNAQNVIPPDGIVFPGITSDSMGHNVLNAVKFACNYGFYKFGLELCHCITVVTACLRADAFSVLYLVFLLVFLFTSRKMCARLWSPYMIILAILIPLQYACCIGLPPGICINYPWHSDTNELNNLIQWLYLPGTYGLPTAKKLTADFFQFAVVALQYRVFRMEQHLDGKVPDGGSNTPILIDLLPAESDRDFVSSKESYLDYLRHSIFYWSYWLSLAVVLATGVVWITLFCLGYMILSFIYLWMGQNVMLRKRTSLISSWNVIIGYNFCVILAKCSMQLIGCVYWNRMINHCWFIQLFGVHCMNPMSWNDFILPHEDFRCSTVSSGLHWDVICFIFILFQRKVFMSNSFCHVYLDLQVQNHFASRGAYLINRKLMLNIYEQAIKQKKSLEKVQEKISRIQKRQEQLGRNTASVTEHYIMLRSGDYYLYEGDPEEEDEDEEIYKTTKTHPPPENGQGTGSGEGGSDPPHSRNGSLSNGHQHHHDSRAFKQSDYDSSASAASRFDPGQMKNRQQQHPITELIDNNSTERTYIKDCWPTAESSVLNILSNYADPYHINRRISKQSFKNSLNSNDNNSINNNNNTVTSDLINSGFLKSHLDNSSYELSKFVNELPLTEFQLGRLFGHRRMRSHPEYPRRAATLNRNTDMVPTSNTLKHVRTSPNQLLDSCMESNQNQPIPCKPSTSKSKAYETHRRLFSTSDVPRPEGALQLNNTPARLRKKIITSTDKITGDIPLTVLSSLSSSPEFSGSSTNQKSISERKPRPARSTTVVPSEIRTAQTAAAALATTTATSSNQPVSMNDSKMSKSMEYFSNTNDTNDDCHPVLEKDNLDSEEEDDANPPFTSSAHLNPLKLLHRAIEFGAKSAMRQLRTRLIEEAAIRAHLTASEDPVRTTANIVTFDDNANLLEFDEKSNVPDEDAPSNARQLPILMPSANPLDKDRKVMSFDSAVEADWRLLGRQLSSDLLLSPRSLTSDTDTKLTKRSSRLEASDDSSQIQMKSLTLPKLSEQEDNNSTLISDYHSVSKAPRHLGPSILKDNLKFRDCRNKARSVRLQPIASNMICNSNANNNHNEMNNNWDETDNDSLNCKYSNLKFKDNKTAPHSRLRHQQPHSHKWAANETENSDMDAPERQFSDTKFHTDDSDNNLENNDKSDKEEQLFEDERSDSCWSKFKAACMIAYMFVLSSVDSLIRLLNGLTRNYRKIRRTIDQEKRLVKRRLITSLTHVNEQSSNQ